MSQNEMHFKAFKWVDVVDPSPAVLEHLATLLKLPQKVLINCLNPDYLPHVEDFGGTQFVVLRLMEPHPPSTADTVQELTTKIVLFVSEDSVYSIHRLPLSEDISAVFQKMKQHSHDAVTVAHVVAYFFERVSIGFDAPLVELERKVDHFEEHIFKGERTKSALREGYYIKRQASAFKKVLRFTLEVQEEVMQSLETTAGHMLVIKDRFERNLFYADDVFENVQSLLSMHLALASQKTNEASFKTNEIVRVLTVLTIFFLPLNFLAGVYGMNFDRIPLLQHEHGFWYALGMMLIMSMGLFIYVFRKGWLRPPTGK